MRPTTLIPTLALLCLLGIANSAHSQTNRVLDLKNKGIAQLPSDPAMQASIEVLDLSNDQLTEIPDAVFKMTGLKKLVLSGNKIQAIPDQIKFLVNLEELYISQAYNSHINSEAGSTRTISDELFKLPKLRVLDMAFFGINEVPKALAGSHIQEVYLGHNKITEVSEEVFMPKSLKVLDLSNNLIAALPDHIPLNPRIEVLRLNGNLITVLPDAVYNLYNVRELSLGENTLINPVTDIKRIIPMTHIARLDISGAGITELPEELADLTELHELDLSNNKLTKLPANFGKLIALEKLSLSGNQLSVLPESMASLTSLVKLDLSHNLFHVIPTELASLTGLRVANLSHNPELSGYSENIKALTSIKVVNLKNTAFNPFQLQHIDEILVACELVY
ncbi:MAG: leucine-rich repeat and death protein 1-like [Bacteroidetes bacterium]|nr:leucine-rich repeat and death protein 1-like [Bacteroidota bacterium]